jgi:predicted metalloprotease with PDZ domain
MLASLALAAVLAASSTAASGGETSYRVTMPEPAAHFFHVEVRYRDVSGPFRFAFPAFAPGGWKIDEVAGNVLDLTAADGAGRALAAAKIDKQTWSIDRPSDGTVVVRYRVYANESGTPYGARVNAAMAHANLATILGYAPERPRAPARLTIAPAPGWKIACSLPESAGRPGEYQAPNFDVLADAIFIAGSWTELGFESGGARYRLVFSQPPDFKDRKVVDDVRAIARETAAAFGQTPFATYLFIYIMEPEAAGHGGIEHLFGTSICQPLDAFEDRDAYKKFLAVTSHELVHAWNVKRLRPAGLGPFDYTRETPTHNLYVAEGFTSYYGPLVEVRGAVITREEYYKWLGEGLVTDRNNVGIREKSLQDHSWDWWLASEIPYLTFRTNYTRGSLVALVLDLEIRSASGGKRSIDDVMRALYDKTASRATGYTDAELRAAFVSAGAQGMDARLDALVTSPGPLDVAAALARVGVEVVPDPATPAVPFVGWRTGTTGKEFPSLDWVEPGSPAARAGLQGRDLIVAIGDRRVSAEKLDKELTRLPPDKPVTIAYFRDGMLRHTELAPGAPVPPKLIVRERTDATPQQKSLLDGWLAARAPQPATTK